MEGGSRCGLTILLGSGVEDAALLLGSNLTLGGCAADSACRLTLRIWQACSVVGQAGCATKHSPNLEQTSLVLAVPPAQMSHMSDHSCGGTRCSNMDTETALEGDKGRALLRSLHSCFIVCKVDC